MKKPDIAKCLARRSGISAGEAADQLDGVVHQILAKLRHGGEASLPGLGKFHLRADGSVAFRRDVDPR